MAVVPSRGLRSAGGSNLQPPLIQIAIHLHENRIRNSFLQTKAGFNVKTELPSQSGPPLEALYAMRDRWLKGGKL